MSFSTTYNSFKRIKLIRYLVVWRVNSSLVTLPRCLAPELSHVLGTIISNRLPTRERSRWQKVLSPLQKHFDAALDREKSRCQSVDFPDNPWPVDAVFFVYPAKTTYGLGELIFWELKLFGDGADHGLFLETILPAMEEASYTSDERWSRPKKIWGRFDIHAVYAARGLHWEPIVSEGRLDLRSHASANQWAEGLTFGSHLELPFRQMIWITPFEIASIEQSKQPDRSDDGGDTPVNRALTMEAILNALRLRLSLLTPGRRKGSDTARHGLDEEGSLILQRALEQAVQTTLIFDDLKAAPEECPGEWTGRHVFPLIPKEIIPCLEIASILHIGKYTHFGCGAFTLA